jgi:hypothetical protein
VRRLRPQDEAAVPCFVILCEFGNTAWKLGLTRTSVGRLISDEELASRIDRWRRCEQDWPACGEL